MSYDQYLSWSFWADATLLAETQAGSRLFEREGAVCFCDPGVEPGDADSFVYGPGSNVALKVRENGAMAELLKWEEQI